MIEKEEKKKELTTYSGVIVDQDADLFNAATIAEQKFYEELKKTSEHKASCFLQMPKVDRAELMSGKLSEADTEERFKYASTKALIYTNDGYIITEKMRAAHKKINAVIGVLLGAAAICLGMDIYFNTIAKNTQLHLESAGVRYELDPAAMNQINNRRENVDDTSRMLTAQQYIQHLMKPNFQCHELKTLKDSFYEPSDGLPKCRQVGDATFVVGYAKNPTFPQPVMNVIKDGQIYNLDLSVSGFSTVQYTLPIVRFEMIPQRFAEAFPDMVRSAAQDVVTRRKEKN